MPTYLVHGFRWNRPSIRIHIILQDLEDAAAEWIVAPATSITLLNSFYSLYDFLPPSNPPPPTYQLPVAHEKVMVQDEKKEEPPKLLTKRNKSMRGLRRISSAAMLKSNGHKAGEGSMDAGKEEQRPNTSAGTSAATSLSADATKSGKRPTFNDWSVVKLVEQYDPDDLVVSQPYAYVADHMVEISLSASLTEEIAKYEAKLKEEEGPLSAPTSTPGTPGTASVGSMGDLASPVLSPREQRRRSRRLGWFEKLRDGLEKGSDIGWFVVVCGDEERAIPSIAGSTSQSSLAGDEADPQRTPTRSGLRGLFHRKKGVREG